MMENPQNNAFDPNLLYDLKYLAFRWNYTEGTKNLEVSLEKAGATVTTVGKGVKLVSFKPLCDPDAEKEAGNTG